LQGHEKAVSSAAWDEISNRAGRCLSRMRAVRGYRCDFALSPRTCPNFGIFRG
jgi:hypothetical protein